MSEYRLLTPERSDNSYNSFNSIDIKHTKLELHFTSTHNPPIDAPCVKYFTLEERNISRWKDEISCARCALGENLPAESAIKRAASTFVGAARIKTQVLFHQFKTYHWKLVISSVLSSKSGIPGISAFTFPCGAPFERQIIDSIEVS